MQSSETTSSCSSLGKTRKVQKAVRKFHKEECEDKYLVTVEHSENTSSETAICILCEQTFKDMKTYTFQRHLDRMHKKRMATIRKWSAKQRKRMIQDFHQKRELQRKSMKDATTPETLQRLAPIRLGYTLLQKSTFLCQSPRALQTLPELLIQHQKYLKKWLQEEQQLLSV